MSKSSTKKGNDLETKIYHLFKDEIEQDRFFIKRKNCKICFKKGYFSKDREKDIIFDMSIEVYLPGFETYSLLIIIECKNYNHPVPVDDLEEFYTKIQQISGANLKGIVVSTNSFQDGSIKFSKSKGIGLIRYFNNSNFKWVLTRSASGLIASSYASETWFNAYKGITEETFHSQVFDFYCHYDGGFSNSKNHFFSSVIQSISSDKKLQKQFRRIIKQSIKEDGFVKYVGFEEIEAICESILNKINYISGDVKLESICTLLIKENDLHVEICDSHNHNSIEENILGKITFKPLSIKIFRRANNSLMREKFTLAHELGHFFLEHCKYMQEEYCTESDLEIEDQRDFGINDINGMEWQANYFASCLLLPKKTFVLDFYSLASALRLSGFQIKDLGYFF